ncbi:MAG TPA: metallophosphoesterase, partial [Gammaproteobacteria bacterium]
MAVYAIGDLQGCYGELRKLLDLIHFNPADDKLWFVGDLVNRGPESLACLRFVKSLGNSAIVTLGNHDLNLLAIMAGLRPLSERN